MKIGKRNKFSIEEKERIVVKLLKGRESYRSVARQLNTSHRLISLWVECYKQHGKAGLTLKNSMDYTSEFRLKVIKEMEKSNISLQEMSVKYLITPSVFSSWRRLYEQNGASALFDKKRRGSSLNMKEKSENKKEKDLTDYQKLLNENERLRVENDYLKKLHALIQKEEAQKKKKEHRSSRN